MLAVFACCGCQDDMKSALTRTSDGEGDVFAVIKTELALGIGRI